MPSDLVTPAALASLHSACFSTPRPWSAGEFAAFMGDPGCFLIGDASGFILGRVAADESELLTLAVAPDLRRRGRGAMLLRAFETTARARAASRAFLEVAADNAPAIGLYHAAGWQQNGRRPNYYKQTHQAGTSGAIDALVLSKSLA